jgi:CHRD domain
MRSRIALAGMLVGAVAVLAMGSYATADSGKKNVDTGPMSGYLEGAPAGPVSSGASGSFDATIEDNQLDYTLSYSGLEADVTQAHIHFGQRSVNGGISAWLCGTEALPGPTGTPRCPGARSGTISDTILAADVIGPTGQGIAAGEFAELVAAIRAGRAYANVHSSMFPGGEVRGQINDDDQRDD